MADSSQQLLDVSRKNEEAVSPAAASTNASSPLPSGYKPPTVEEEQPSNEATVAPSTAAAPEAQAAGDLPIAGAIEDKADRVAKIMAIEDNDEIFKATEAMMPNHDVFMAWDAQFAGMKYRKTAKRAKYADMYKALQESKLEHIDEDKNAYRDLRWQAQQRARAQGIESNARYSRAKLCTPEEHRLLDIYGQRDVYVQERRFAGAGRCGGTNTDL
ncbi:hypothetical protein CLAFUW4_05769 [Fulvia fulva]|uniref:Uncharacterized protein n=1 Tax=Passalora fulva TaxID=5499 RepID=A0A9Q8P8I3_PASFU|nr:uncharacterized protein CLAFUR5_05911 [Fulvia fulva]KAK4624655.1 hypothetical protein CLAFUR4_05763 [Fulvia fulva]KAK4625011.1 hypothetical protein CLAFUR0_05774 [Fulvia fulva]UJO17173.1 hypothetical protein CLAFUR5_05911 [Fulvia fulva]WPV14608.1 hypothetical protein CLAFUW4_05769 [Fulvia fulva]WPV29761.1 hypothetical protein CLAFUW7_05767 [Fulvia fulva]